MKIPNPFSKPTTQTNLTSGSDGSVVTQTSQTSEQTQSSSEIKKQIDALVPGQTLQGEVVSKNGNEITLKVAGDMVLTARLERELNIELGKLLTFQVKNNGKVLSLSPLFANMSMEKTASKALDMANIPLTERNIQMATSMMERGMPVDVESIQNVYKDVVAFSKETVNHIIKLHQMNIPVTTETLLQLVSYENMEHQISLGMEQVFSDLQSQGLDQTMLGQVLSVFEGTENEVFIPIGSVLNDLELHSLELQLKPFMEQPIKASMPVKELLIFLSQVKTEGTLELQEGKKVDASLYAPINSDLTNPSSVDSLSAIHVLQEDTSLPNQEVIATHISLDQKAQSFNSFLEGELIGKLLKAFASELWTLTPDQVADKQRVMDVYVRITKQLEGLKHVLEGADTEKGTSLKSIHTLQNNINFMHHLNQLYTYIQIPLTMNGKNTQGELYVYTNKKNLAKEDGTVSALLHLDMEYLGPVDVYVTMQNQKVNTNFYLATDELLDFIQEHIYILDEHLAKRGYSLSCQMMLREDDNDRNTFNVMHEIAKEDPEKIVLSQYAFDVRA